MTLKKQSIIAILCAGVLFSCVPARKYEELKSKQTACFEENNTLKSQNQELEEKNKELFASTEKMRKEKEGMEHEIKVLEKSLDQMTKNYDNVNATYQLLLDKNNELLAGNKSATEQLMKQLQKTQEELQAQEDALRALEGTLQKKETTLNKLTEELQAREKRVNELESLISRQDSMVNALKNKVKEALLGFENNGLTIEQKNGKVYVSLDESLLFASGSYSVGERGIDALKKLAKVLEQNQEINVLVEGHTDNVPLKGSGDIKDNWDLSVKRATSVVKIITENSKTNPKRLTAAGRGEYFPLDLTNTPEGRKKNRRIEVILTPKLDELFELLETN
ncbi:MAG: cell envelope biogenesis protein OmpA [Flavobacteriales bacterium CG18_big_fil_WC_8_21_14_2_50_32_9]|nr:MAG: cell envelope biogenesis protein OmpA [Flavobacteriales bacterium CG18_big_fil_WC_8_21_14_2_50_32_9]PIZ06192.1 MAG: cell envelope biogenesis protein OmpA [Flavobacteriales bacterium CG_4_10_14_0_8_um_filter_32_5]PJC62606.1 MAG: cell envelope biogenesis protein OmpA [Flavobacteriales bacterium CG_4_9_14_0_2_um_filter_32_27]